LTSPAQSQDWVDRQQELRRLRDAMQKRESLLIWGDADSGKTALVAKVLDQLPKKMERACLLVEGGASVKELLLKMVRCLWEKEHPLVTGKWRAAQGSHYTVSGWLRGQSGGRLRSMVRDVLKSQPCWILLDHFPPCTQLVGRFLKDLMWRWNTPVYVLARGFSPIELGEAWGLYWNDKLRLPVGPLPEADAARLLAASIRRFGLARFDLEEFQSKVLRLSGRLPGAIVKMCALAADPKYQYERRIKTTLIHVDYLMGRQAEIFEHSGTPEGA
jgi:hypothetical protein